MTSFKGAKTRHLSSAHVSEHCTWPAEECQDEQPGSCREDDGHICHDPFRVYSVVDSRAETLEELPERIMPTYEDLGHTGRRSSPIPPGASGHSAKSTHSWDMFPRIRAQKEKIKNARRHGCCLDNSHSEDEELDKRTKCPTACLQNSSATPYTPSTNSPVSSDPHLATPSTATPLSAHPKCAPDLHSTEGSALASVPLANDSSDFVAEGVPYNPVALSRPARQECGAAKGLLLTPPSTPPPSGRLPGHLVGDVPGVHQYFAAKQDYTNAASDQTEKPEWRRDYYDWHHNNLAKNLQKSTQRQNVDMCRVSPFRNFLVSLRDFFSDANEGTYTVPDLPPPPSFRSKLSLDWSEREGSATFQSASAFDTKNQKVRRPEDVVPKPALSRAKKKGSRTRSAEGYATPEFGSWASLPKLDGPQVSFDEHNEDLIVEGGTRCEERKVFRHHPGYAVGVKLGERANELFRRTYDTGRDYITGRRRKEDAMMKERFKALLFNPRYLVRAKSPAWEKRVTHSNVSAHALFELAEHQQHDPYGDLQLAHETQIALQQEIFNECVRWQQQRRHNQAKRKNFYTEAHHSSEQSSQSILNTPVPNGPCPPRSDHQNSSHASRRSPPHLAESDRPRVLRDNSTIRVICAPNKVRTVHVHHERPIHVNTVHPPPASSITVGHPVGVGPDPSSSQSEQTDPPAKTTINDVISQTSPERGSDFFPNVEKITQKIRLAASERLKVDKEIEIVPVCVRKRVETRVDRRLPPYVRRRVVYEPVLIKDSTTENAWLERGRRIECDEPQCDHSYKVCSANPLL